MTTAFLGYNYAQRAAEAEAARRAVGPAFEAMQNRFDETDPGTLAWKAALDRFNKALKGAYPKHFWRDYQRLKQISRWYAALDKPGEKAQRQAAPLNRGDAAALETAIEFLEGDPMFFRSGYVKAELIKFIVRMPLNETQAERLRDAALDIVDKRCTEEFRRYCRLARKVDGPGLREGLRARAGSADPSVARRARWMLEAVEGVTRKRPRLTVVN